jgi:NAD(P)-dependent dehydrogenase (short-subunit alcohol dehydrogenase family)
MNIRGCSALITGGASGIGESTAKLLTENGAICVIVDRNEELGVALAASINGVFVKADVTDEAAVEEAVEAASTLAPLRVLVNAAGVGRPGRTIDRDGAALPLSVFQRVVQINLVGTFNCTRLAAAAMAKTEPLDDDGQRGAIVNIASVAAFDGQIGQAAYSASKGGVVSMTLPLARDLAVVGIRVNTIAPGLIDTPIYGQGERADEFKANLAANVLFPMRLGSAPEIASMVVEMITNDYVNGEVVRVDGAIRMPPK